MNKIRLSIILLLAVIQISAVAQKKSIVSASITGSVMLTTDGSSLFYNMGGPGVKFTKNNWMLGINMLPSLRFFKDDPRPFITPMLGAGILIGYKRLMVGVPLYYLSAKSEWIISAGVGVKLGN
jgi:hypothetical protein